ncbi:cadherin repeat domain-containing protein [Joostella sp.]|uniref:cadherin repeat domain-containing protein n=1 Tax=Joostella sp. TaxID=2231138 RepID=UPI003A8D2A40
MKLNITLLLNLLFLCLISCNKDDEPTTVIVDDFITEINEFPESNQVIGTIQTSPSNGNSTYTVTSQSPVDAFSINPKTGELKVLDKSKFNFAINPVIVGTIEVRNGDNLVYSSVTINVKDVERVFDGSITVETQTQLDDFGEKYYDRINGDVYLSGKNIVSTNSLNSIKFINGYILILGTNLKNVDGFSNANLADGTVIQIVNNQLLENLNGLQSVTAKLMNLEIYNNPKINNIDGLENITSVTDKIVISDTENLENLNGLSGINNPVKMLSIRNNIGLIDTNGLSNIPKITMSFQFTNNDLVASLNNMSNLKEINRFFLDRNAGLKNIDGLSKLETCLELVIQNNVSLQNLNGLINLKKVNYGYMRITDNTSLRDFCGLSLIASTSTVGYNIRDNYYNPTKDDIKNGNCSL